MAETNPAIVASAIEGAAAVANTGGGLFASAMNNRANRKAADLAYKRGIRNWNLQNAYNSPAAQMQRFKDAGLNPNLIYGQGNSGNASPPPEYRPPHIEKANPVPNFSGITQTYMNAQQMQAGIEQVKANTELTRARTNTEFVNQALKALGKDKLALDINKLQSILPYQLEIQRNQAESSKYDVQKKVTEITSMGMKQATELLQQEYLKRKISQTEQATINMAADWIYKNKTNELRNLGLSDKDPVWLKILGAIGNNKLVGDTPAQKAQSLWDWIKFHWSY